MPQQRAKPAPSDANESPLEGVAITGPGREPGTPARSGLLAFALCVAAYLYVFPYQPAINNPNENVRFYMTAALVEEGSYAIDGMRARWGWVNDAAVRDGHIYSVKAPGTSFLGVPGYALYHAWEELHERPVDRQTALWVCRITATIIPMLVWLWFFQAFLGRYTRHPALRDATFLAVALGSLVYGYGLLFVSHSVAGACAAAGLMCMSSASRRPGRVRALGAGLFSAGVTLFEYHGLLASLALCGLCLLRWPRRALPWFGLGAALPTLAMMHFQWRAFGSPLVPGHRFLENPAYRALSDQGFFGATGFHPEAAWGLLFDLGYGLFPLCPILIWALPGALCGLRERTQRAPVGAALTLATLTTLGICFMNNWRGGWTVGPRYLALAVPALGWLSLRGLDWLAERLPRLASGVAIGSLATGLVLSGSPSVWYPHLPEALTRPVSQLIWLLVRHDFAPLNAGNLLGWYGSASMLPMLLVGTLCLGSCLWSARTLPGQSRPGNLRATAAVATLVASAMLWLTLATPPNTARIQRTIAHITERWHPEGHDKVARMRALPASHRRTQTYRARLDQLLEDEGRSRTVSGR